MNKLLKATALCALLTSNPVAADDILITDFEGADYGTWKAEGDAFGTGPAHRKIGGQRNVEGILGKGHLQSLPIERLLYA
ncbi:MAG: hypothetical protein SGI77_19690 [Pirellulaceae bacterium]|nr:hypothetical protein [Pirellulaceae bacterium]